MTRLLISSGSPFEKTVGYSRAVVQGDWCFVAGTKGYDPETRAMPEDVRDQAKNALAIVEKALDERGFQLADVVRATSSEERRVGIESVRRCRSRWTQNHTK